MHMLNEPASHPVAHLWTALPVELFVGFATSTKSLATSTDGKAFFSKDKFF
jgi:hypothetical protein